MAILNWTKKRVVKKTIVKIKQEQEHIRTEPIIKSLYIESIYRFRGFRRRTHSVARTGFFKFYNKGEKIKCLKRSRTHKLLIKSALIGKTPFVVLPA